MIQVNEDTKIAFFDFDGTLVNFDTVNPYIRYVLKRHPEHDVAPDLSLPHKQYRLRLLAGLSKTRLEELAQEFYTKQVRPHFIQDALDELRRLQAEGYYICLISGSYDLYLQFFVKEFGIDQLICTWVQFEDGTCTGRFAKLDCLHENKLTLMRETFGTDDFTSCQSVAYSDAQSDLPLLRSCKNAVVVVAGKDKVKSWMTDEQFELLLYKIPLRTLAARKIGWHWRRLRKVSN